MESELSKKDVKVINNAKGIAKWLKIDLKISVFGVTILEWTFPPQSNKED